MLILLSTLGLDQEPSLIRGPFPDPISFPVRPIQADFQFGYETAKRKSASLVSIALGDRQPIGSWFDGTLPRDVETVIWVSPRLVSRWLGFLARRELWDEGEAERRWESIRSGLEGKLTFIVELAALKKLSLLELTPEVPADPLEIRRLKFSLSGNNQTFPLRVESLGEWQVRDRKKLQDFKWYRHVPFAKALIPEFEAEPDPPLFPMGDFFGAWYVVDGFATPELQRCPTLTLTILSPTKERKATYPGKTKLDPPQGEAAKRPIGPAKGGPIIDP